MWMKGKRYSLISKRQNVICCPGNTPIKGPSAVLIFLRVINLGQQNEEAVIVCLLINLIKIIPVKTQSRYFNFWRLEKILWSLKNLKNSCYKAKMCVDD